MSAASKRPQDGLVTGYIAERHLLKAFLNQDGLSYSPDHAHFEDGHSVLIAAVEIARAHDGLRSSSSFG